MRLVVVASWSPAVGQRRYTPLSTRPRRGRVNAGLPQYTDTRIHTHTQRHKHFTVASNPTLDTHTHTHTDTHTHAHTKAHTKTHTHTHMQIHIKTHAHGDTNYKDTYAHKRARRHTLSRTHTYTYIHVHTPCMPSPASPGELNQTTTSTSVHHSESTSLHLSLSHPLLSHPIVHPISPLRSIVSHSIQLVPLNV